MLHPELADKLRTDLRGTHPTLSHLVPGIGQDRPTTSSFNSGLLLADGRAAASTFLTTELGYDDSTASRILEGIDPSNVELTGAEAVAVLLARSPVRTVFVYAGTSELALCDAVAATPGIDLINGRGDKESAFMAAGGALLTPGTTAAVLHGARGLTNAAGAVADARRNECGTLYLVGLPSTNSAPFLPPHGEASLMEGVGTFADWVWEAPTIPDEASQRREAAQRFVTQLLDALNFISEPPTRPALFAVPQDVAEARWIPLDTLVPPDHPSGPVGHTEPTLDQALDLIEQSTHPVLLVDDYALRYPGFTAALNTFANLITAPVLQLRYRRGPMLFERLQPSQLNNFIGWLNPVSASHTEVLGCADLIVTIEDRNFYERVAGRLPDCAKLAINSDPAKVVKNRYLQASDSLLVGNPTALLTKLIDRLRTHSRAAPSRWFAPGIPGDAYDTPEEPDRFIRDGRRDITTAIADTLAGWDHPVLVDDSQMFGGMLSDDYDQFPSNIRVFGGHGGFVGCGIPLATGLAITEPTAQVMCTLGDQAFTNSLQGLIATIQQRARVTFLVCNNGRSVSLNKQAGASFGPSRRTYLDNVDQFQYWKLSESLGIPSFRVDLPIGAQGSNFSDGLSALRSSLRKASAHAGPTLVELVLPSDAAVWRGLWLTQGLEAVSVGAR